MDYSKMEQKFELIGAPCVVRGSYTFYKALKYTKNGVTNILTINEFFFVKLWADKDLICIGELKMLWEDQTCDKALAWLRLYILPENTPDGRIADMHGEDEVLAITEKVIIKLEDLLMWVTEAPDWSWGIASLWTRKKNSVKELNDEKKINGSIDDDKNKIFQQNKTNTLEDFSAINYADVLREKSLIDIKNWEIRTGVVVLSYSRYCRYRALLKRLEGAQNDSFRDDLINTLGGFSTTYRTTKILFCRDTFDYPDLEVHELLCNHLAPKLRSRIPKKKKTLYPSPDVSESDDSSDYATEDDEHSSEASSSSNRSSCSVAVRCSSVNETVKKTDVRKFNTPAQRAFIQNLYAFMKARLTPIDRLPLVGNKELNLYEFYNKVKFLGGYHSVTNKKMWKYVFEELGGDRDDPSMATLMRKYFEKFLLPYEQHVSQQIKYSIHQSTSGIVKTQYLPATITECRMQADRRKINVARSLPPGIKIIDTRTITGFVMPVTGDKENIPLSDKRKITAGSHSAEVIDLCAEDEGTSRIPSAEIIDLCEESPIKRSIPSIAAALPKKRKLDILREGGLEVTPISSNASGSSSPDVVTITRNPSSSSRRNSPDRGETTVEILDPKKYSSLGHNSKSRPKGNQVLDLTKKIDDKEIDVVKKFGPNLGPNIEISLVANDSKKDEKKRKSFPLPVPALRKISTGELSVKNLAVKMSSNDDICKPKVTITAKKTTDASRTSTKPLVSITSSVTVTPQTHQNSKEKSANTAFVSGVNQSLYLAALYNTIFPTSGASGFVSDTANSNSYQLQLTQPQLNYVKGAFMHQHPDLESVGGADAFAQKFSNMLKNGAVSIVENYEKILPD